MGGSSTVYDVRVRYAMESDKAAKGANQLASSLDKAGEKAFSLKGALAAIGGAVALKKGYDMLVGFNSEIDSMKINMSTIMQMQLKMPFEKANKEADKLFNTFQELAKKSPATTKDFMEMAQAIAAPIAMMGGGPDKLAKLTQGAVIAGQAFGERADVVALDMKQMLAGTVGAKDRTAQQLLSGAGIKQDDWNGTSGGKNAMNGVDRAKKLEEILSSPVLLKAADRMGESLVGQISTFQDQLQITLGQVGRPLMEGITAEVKKWNTWIERHPKLIKQYVSDFAGMIKGAFTFVKDTAGWLVEHKDLLFAIGKTFLVFKGAQIGTQVFKKFADGVGNFVGSLKTSASSVAGLFSGGGGGLTGGFKGLVGVLSGAGGVIPALGLFAGALGIVFELLNTHAEEDKKGREAAMSLNEATGDMPGLMSRRKELEMRLKNPMFAGSREQDTQELASTKSKMFDPEALGLALRKIDEASIKHGGSSLKNMSMGQLQQANQLGRWAPDTFDSRNVEENTKIMKDVEATLQMFNNLTADQRREVLKNAWSDRWGMPAGPSAPVEPGSKWGEGVTPPSVNVTIQRIEVAAEDPDRFVFGLVKIAESAMKHPTSSQHTTSGGM